MNQSRKPILGTTLSARWPSAQCRCDEAESTRQRLHSPRPSDPPLKPTEMTMTDVDGGVSCVYCWDLIR